MTLFTFTILIFSVSDLIMRNYENVPETLKVGILNPSDIWLSNKSTKFNKPIF